MRRSTRILRVFWISGLFVQMAALTACTNRAPSLRMLDTRAGYDSPYDDEEVALYEKARAHGEMIGRSFGPRIAKVYVYPHELPSRDYFWGGYISLVVRQDEVVFDPPEEAAADEAPPSDKLSSTKAAPIRKKIRRPPTKIEATQ